MGSIKSVPPKGVGSKRTEKDIQYLLKSISVERDAIIIDYGCSDGGYVGTSIARAFPSCQVYLVADNLKDSQNAEMNVRESRLANAFVHVDNTLGFLQDNVPSIVIVKPSGWEGKQVLHSRMVESLRRLRLGGQFYLVTHMRRGAPSLVKLLAQVFGDFQVLVKGGGGIRIVRAVKTAKMEGERDPGPNSTDLLWAQILGKQYTFQTNQALFSKEHIDMGTLLLLESVQVGSAQRILDLGCGYGVIGIVMASQYPDKEITLVDVDFQAIEATKANIHLNGCECNSTALLSDGFRQIPGARFDLVLTHFPLHVSKEEQIRLLTEAKNALNSRGRLCLVAQSSYDLRFVIQKVFGNFSTIADTSHLDDQASRYRVICATVPE